MVQKTVVEGEEDPEPSRVLIATNHLERISGSEIVALEVARHFVSTGSVVDVVANWTEMPMKALMEAETGRQVSTEPSSVRPFTYDIVYTQHQMLGLFDYSQSDNDRALTTIATGRLSRRSYLESGGWLHDNFIVDRVLANSDLTAEHLLEVGTTSSVTAFYNAAPNEFFRPFAQKPKVPKKALVVSNHKDPDLLQAVDILSQHIDVLHVGRSGNTVELVTPAMIAATDVVVSIGKTVPYALASRVPVFVYDHFGGPGYLDESRIETALRSSFTGLCCKRKLSGHEIASEILSDYSRGVAFARDSSATFLDRFRLAPYLDLLRDPPLIDNAGKRARLRSNAFTLQERLLAEHVRRDYLDAQAAKQNARELRRRVRRAEHLREHQKLGA